jgi:hypothetical protein
MNSIRWTPAAGNELAEIWLQAGSSDREELTAEIAAVETALSRNPHQVGESRDSARRIAFLQHLVLDFAVMSDDRLVVIFRVWPRRRSQ